MGTFQFARSSRPLAIALSWFFLHNIATAQLPAEPQVPAKSLAQGEVDTQRSRVYIRVGKTGFGHEHAVVGMLKAGQVSLGHEDNAGELIFELGSFVADPDYARQYIGLEGLSDPATQQKVTANMRGSEVLDVARFPTANFRIKSARLTQRKSSKGLAVHEFSGEFSLHGVTRAIQFPVEVEQFDGWAHVRGSFKIRQTDFGMTPFSKAFGTIGVANELQIFGDLYIAQR